MTEKSDSEYNREMYEEWLNGAADYVRSTWKKSNGRVTPKGASSIVMARVHRRKR